MDKCEVCDEERANAEAVRCAFCGCLACEACCFDVMQEATGRVRWCCQNEECDERAAEWMEKSK